MTAHRPWKVPIGFALALCTALLLTASTAFATATADIEIQKSSDVSSVAAGGTITYTITATNLGPNGASQVVIEDDVPTTLTNIQISSVTQPSQCTVVGNTITCNMQGLGASGSINTIVFTADVVGSTEVGTQITNCAFELSSNSNDPDHTNDSSPFSCGQGVSVVDIADLSVTKTQTSPDPGTVTTVPGGTNITYHIVATNNGPSTATNVVVGDSFTVGSATFVSVDNPSAGLDCSTFTALPGQCTIASLASGDSVSFDLTVTAPNDGTTSITNTATTSSDTTDNDTSNNTSSVSTDICQSVDLALTKQCQSICPVGDAITKTAICPADITDIQGGSDFQYTITVTNNDTAIDATNVVISDTLPASVSYVSDDGGCDTSALPVITCSTSSIAHDSGSGGGTFTVHIVVKAIESGPSENSATATADQCDRNTEDNTSSCSVTIHTNNMPTALEVDREGCSNGSSPFCTGDADSVATVSDVNRVLEPGETVRVDPAWTNTLDNDDPDTTGVASNPTSPAGGTLVIDDTTADYGAIPAGQQSDCQGVTASSPNSTGTGDCYEVTVTEDVLGVRPVQHWDTHFTETLSSGEIKTWTLHVGDSFTDVLRSNFFYRFVETIYHNGITVGGGFHCTSAQFCPAQATRRDQLTAFVARSLENGTDSNVPVSGTGYDCNGSTSNFSDTPAHSTFCRHANFLFVNHIVNGCAPGLLCAADPTTRGQMASVVDKALWWQAGNTSDPDGAVPTAGTDGASRTYDCTSGPGPFSDVPAGSQFCKYIGDLWVRHVIDGYGDGTFRPGTTIRRDEASKVLANAFVNVPLYGPLPGLGL